MAMKKTIKYKNKKWTHFLFATVASFLFFIPCLPYISLSAQNSSYTQKGTNASFARKGLTENTDLRLWNGPILYHRGNGKPVDFILVEKSLQKLSLYRYNGHYTLLKSYKCGTGEKKGKKRKEKDEKTPEGIYFNTKTYRDSKVTVFGDRAFGLNYPDVYDTFEGNSGGGIFIHGSNHPVKPFSSNGCIVLNNHDLAGIDKLVALKNVPVIIGDRLPYRFQSADTDFVELVPFLKQAMLPESYSTFEPEFRSFTVFRFKKRIVVTGNMVIKGSKNIIGCSRLYLIKPANNMMVLLKRVWNEEKLKVAQNNSVPRAKPKVKPQPKKSEADKIVSLVGSWRRAWEGKKLNEYITHYHPAFKSNGKNRVAWKRYKKRLNRRNRHISVKISGIKVKVNGRKAKVYFKQLYRSDTFYSKGYKMLEFKKKGISWKIFREQAYANKPSGWPG